MSRRAAIATGLVGPELTTVSNICGDPHGPGRPAVRLLHRGKVGIIAVGPAIRMDDGSGSVTRIANCTPSTRQAVDDGPGRIAVDAPGAKVPAHYRVGVATTIRPTRTARSPRSLFRRTTSRATSSQMDITAGMSRDGPAEADAAQTGDFAEYVNGCDYRPCSASAMP